MATAFEHLDHRHANPTTKRRRHRLTKSLQRSPADLGEDLVGVLTEPGGATGSARSAKRIG
jgi:hypothetical protein